MLGGYVTLFNALSDELRLKVLLYLYVNGERCVCDIESFFDISQSSISYHLKILSDASIIKKKKVAVWNYYSLNENSNVNSIIIDIFKNINKEEWKDNVPNN
ncbi:ArsR/SmtB family transcription factor [Schnuerera sp. xch1]|uniref:ArsR/SmtB family transcription factor n=1 Tax=Schnuerera sp. xch1 TaxID=2874283 RepID=UPI001CBF77B0|nr:metalloregulator ArsR/SmtB family transcription factor [Schnuerera sp. xch1]